jgi:hypothetical protein
MDAARPTPRLPRAWYSASFEDFLAQSNVEVLGQLVAHSNFSVETDQRNAWLDQLNFLRSWLAGRNGFLLLEFNIPRMGLRVDAVLLLGGCVVMLEFKIGEKAVSTAALHQAWEYALDTKNFHEPSHSLPIIPVLVPTEYRAPSLPALQFAADGVCQPIAIGPSLMQNFLDEVTLAHPSPIDPVEWATGRYKPTPTIIEAARHLYANHSVADIVRTEADERSLSDTARRVESLISRAKTHGEKVIVFITGVPGAGKTLVGLNIATSHREESDTHAVFLSGNGPLVTVLREALTRDDIERRRRLKQRVTKEKVSKPIKAFIQNVHHFRRDGLHDPVKPPTDRIVIFDEAQRAWNRRGLSRFMQKRHGVADFDQSEPEVLIEYLHRHQGWAAIVCLVGGGQEINRDEAGIGEWIEACSTRFPDWILCVSDRLQDSEYGAGEPIKIAAARQRTEFYSDLHLAVSIRSFRAEKVSAFVKALLDCDEGTAKKHFATFHDRYPIVITRNLDAAKTWVREQTRGMQRHGLLASSKAMRLKPHAIDVRLDTDPVHYFLGDSDDVRSSFYLEDCATEFQVQGLELDWAIVNWDADLRRNSTDWSYHDFRGSKWQNIKSEEHRRNLKNAYRVLLTRARQGMAIFVPPGSVGDHTRLPEQYDNTFHYLRNLGLREI